MVIGVISDSDSSSKRAEDALTKKQPELVSWACFAHQINLFSGYVLTHETNNVIAKSEIDIIEFLNSFFNYQDRLDSIVEEKYGRTEKFVSVADTRWYRDYVMIFSSFSVKKSLK